MAQHFFSVRPIWVSFGLPDMGILHHGVSSGFYAFGLLQQHAKKKLLPENRMSGIMLIFAVEKQQCKELIL